MTEPTFEKRGLGSPNPEKPCIQGTARTGFRVVAAILSLIGAAMAAVMLYAILTNKEPPHTTTFVFVGAGGVLLAAQMLWIAMTGRAPFISAGNETAS